MKTPHTSLKRLKVYIAILVTAIVAGAVIYGFLSPTSSLVESITARISSDYCNEQNAQTTSHIKSFLDNSFSELCLVQISLDVIPEMDETTLRSVLSRLETENPNTYYAVVDENGMVYTPERSFLGTLSLSFLGDLLNGQDRVVSNNETFNSHNCIFTGLHFDNGIKMGDVTLIAAISGIRNESISDNIVLTSDFSGGFSNIISKDGSFIVKNNSNQHDGNNAFSILRNVHGVSEESLSTVIQAIQAGEPSFLRISNKNDGNSEFLYYAPISGTSWYIENTLPESFIYSSVGNLRTHLTRLAVIVISSIAVVAVLIVLAMAYGTRILQKSRDELARQHEQLELQNVELAKQEKALKEALDMAQAANRAKTTFLNSMSHDIRTPMNAIIGFTALAAKHIDDKNTIIDYLGKISQSGEHLMSLINDVLDMSRIESGKLALNETKESLSQILKGLRNIVHADITAKQQELFLDAMDVSDELILCDKLRLNQVLLNILSNAIKYTQPGGHISMRVIETQKANAVGYAQYEFRVKDNGIGMSEEYLKTIFEPFTRERTSTVSGIQGTGLGMAITKSIVEMMGGTITVNSQLHEGSEFVVTVSFKTFNRNDDLKPLHMLNGLRSLVVDDDMNACQSVSQMLRQIGMRAEWCSYGKEAIVRTEEAVRINDTFKVYIIDMAMPDMNGIETTRRIRRVVGDDIPIIILTAYDWGDVEKEAREAGVTAFINKPLFQSDLHRTLSEACGESVYKDEKKTQMRDFSGRRILLVEDNELNREIAVEILEEAGFVLDEAEDGTVAVDKVKACKPGQYDLILMDIQMPTMNGYEATRAIRALPESYRSQIPIIAMTANAFEEDKKKAFEVGMNAHVAKPIDVEKLFSTLSSILK